MDVGSPLAVKQTHMLAPGEPYVDQQSNSGRTVTVRGSFRDTGLFERGFDDKSLHRSEDASPIIAAIARFVYRTHLAYYCFGRETRVVDVSDTLSFDLIRACNNICTVV